MSRSFRRWRSLADLILSKKQQCVVHLGTRGWYRVSAAATRRRQFRHPPFHPSTHTYAHTTLDVPVRPHPTPRHMRRRLLPDLISFSLGAILALVLSTAWLPLGLVAAAGSSLAATARGRLGDNSSQVGKRKIPRSLWSVWYFNHGEDA